MGREVPFRVILPENYSTRAGKYPVLYLLHGLFGNCDNWLELTGIEDYLSDKEFVAVLPDSGDKWYSDSATIENDKFESSFIKEFIPAVERAWHIAGSRDKRAIAGLSMGGYGAFKYALKYSHLFICAGSMSGAFDAPGLTADAASNGQRELLPSLSEVFGNETGRARLENDLFEIVRRMPDAKVRSLPYLYFDCGSRDDFLKANRDFADLLEKKRIAFDFVEAAGAHDWIYWDRQVRLILELTAKIFSEQREVGNKF